MSAHELAGWTPTRISWQDGPAVEWCLLEGGAFAEPFFEQTVSRRRHAAPVVWTPISALDEVRDSSPVIAPTGFVFHMSRCGSTLISQMLAASPTHIVISEADPIDSVLRSRVRWAGCTDDDRMRLLRGLISAYGWPRTGSERRLFVKFDSWSVLDLPLINAAYPDVPWIFVSRRPVDVLASHARERGSQMVPGMLEAELLGFDRSSIAPHDLDGYAARVLGVICEAAIRHRAIGRGMVLDHAELPSAMWTRLASHFDVTLEPEDIARMQQVAQFHAKRPYEPYEPGNEPAPGSATLRLLADRWVDPWYRQLQEDDE